MVGLQIPFLTPPSCAASLGGAVGCAVGVSVHLARPPGPHFRDRGVAIKSLLSSTYK
eukprot:COSAG02_NODE_157_length_32999_cov_31.863647_28_plen_57_part_00